MRVSAIAAALVLLSLATVFAQQRVQGKLYPMYADGFDTVFLDDMSWVTDIHFSIKNADRDNGTFFIYGNGRMRTLKPTMTQGGEFEFFVDAGPHWFAFGANYIDLHMITIGNDQDLWAVGPVQGYTPGLVFPGRRPDPDGYGLDVLVQTTKGDANNIYGGFAPVGFQSTFFAMRPYEYQNELYSYFLGFWPEFTNVGNSSFPVWVPLYLSFGVLRARYNMTANDNDKKYWDGQWSYNHTSIDRCAVTNNSRFQTYNEYKKPILLHAYNYSLERPYETMTIVALPGSREVRSIVSDMYWRTPLTLTNYYWNSNQSYAWGTEIVSAVFSPLHHIVIIGLSWEGQGTGEIVFLFANNLTLRGNIKLPSNYTDPRALVVDEYDYHLYVASNGGGPILKINIEYMNIVGYQNVPFYLTRAWAGHSTQGHLFFVTNEQHAKVFRLNKLDFCSSTCPMWGYCRNTGTWREPNPKCVCGQGFELKDNQCQWVSSGSSSGSASKAGEAVLGVFFAISFVAACIGWYIVYKNKRSGYQAV